jgi:hypothetical protein
MTGGLPSSSAQALVAVERNAAPHGLKTSFDELDDDDFAAIGRAFTGTPRLVLSGMGAVLGGAAAGVAVAVKLSFVGGIAVVVGIAGFAIVVGRRDLRATLVDHGLAPELVEALFRVSAKELRRAVRRASPPADPWRVVPRAEDFVRSGRILAEAARAESER